MNRAVFLFIDYGDGAQSFRFSDLIAAQHCVESLDLVAMGKLFPALRYWTEKESAQ